MMTKPTPGPWRIERLINPSRWAIGAPSSGTIAEIYRSNSLARDRADAALMAAAPEMLRALEAIDQEGSDANKNGDVTIPSEIWDLIQQSLKLARQ